MLTKDEYKNDGFPSSGIMDVTEVEHYHDDLWNKEPDVMEIKSSAIDHNTDDDDDILVALNKLERDKGEPVTDLGILIDRMGHLVLPVKAAFDAKNSSSGSSHSSQGQEDDERVTLSLIHI